MGTYIIHFDDKPWKDLDDEQYYCCKEIPWFSTTDTTISRLTPYTEDSAYAHGYTEAESKYREIKDELEKQAYQRGYEEAKHECEDCNANAVKIADDNAHEAYQKGLEDAWEAAIKVVALSTVDRRKVFGSEYMYSILENHTASEAIEKIRQYEQKQEDQIKVGDEVRSIHHGWTAVVSAIDRECMTLMDTNGKLGDGYDVNRFTKTGRHFPEIAEVLQKMKEANNG